MWQSRLEGSAGGRVPDADLHVVNGMEFVGGGLADTFFTKLSDTSALHSHCPTALALFPPGVNSFIREHAGKGFDGMSPLFPSRCLGHHGAELSPGASSSWRLGGFCWVARSSRVCGGVTE